MGIIIECAFERIRINSRGHEIVSLTKVFNKILKLLEMHEYNIVRSLPDFSRDSVFNPPRTQ